MRIARLEDRLHDVQLVDLMAAAREAWEHAGRPGDVSQLRLADRTGRVFACVVCEDRGCEFCSRVAA